MNVWIRRPIIVGLWLEHEVIISVPSRLGRSQGVAVVPLGKVESGRAEVHLGFKYSTEGEVLKEFYRRLLTNFINVMRISHQFLFLIAKIVYCTLLVFEFLVVPSYSTFVPAEEGEVSVLRQPKDKLPDSARRRRKLNQESCAKSYELTVMMRDISMIK